MEMRGWDDDVTAREIAEATDVSNQTFSDHVEVLVEQKEKVGNAWTYWAKFYTNAVRTFQ